MIYWWGIAVTVALIWVIANFFEFKEKLAELEKRRHVLFTDYTAKNKEVTDRIATLEDCMEDVFKNYTKNNLAAKEVTDMVVKLKYSSMCVRDLLEAQKQANHDWMETIHNSCQAAVEASQSARALAFSLVSRVEPEAVLVEEDADYFERLCRLDCQTLDIQRRTHNCISQHLGKVNFKIGDVLMLKDTILHIKNFGFMSCVDLFKCLARVALVDWRKNRLRRPPKDILIWTISCLDTFELSGLRKQKLVSRGVVTLGDLLRASYFDGLLEAIFPLVEFVLAFEKGLLDGKADNTAGVVE